MTAYPYTVTEAGFVCKRCDQVVPPMSLVAHVKQHEDDGDR